jgi:hypothetical protein
MRASRIGLASSRTGGKDEKEKDAIIAAQVALNEEVELVIGSGYRLALSVKH